MLRKDDIDLCWDFDKDTVKTRPCRHYQCNNMNVSFYTAVLGIKKQILPRDILNVFKFSFVHLFSCAKLMGLSENQVVKSPRLWQSIPNLKLWNPKFCFVFPDSLLNDFIGFVPDNKFRDNFQDRVFDFDGISLPREIPNDKYEQLFDEYIQSVICTLKPFGTCEYKRENLARIVPGKKVPFAYILGITWE